MSSSSFAPLINSKSTMPSRPSQLRQTNARGLLQLLQEHSPCSKADLVRCSGLSAPTVSSGISYLQKLGLIEHLGDGESSGGRPPGLLRFNATHGYVAAADIGGTHLRMMLADLAGNVITDFSLTLAQDKKTPQAICAYIVEGVQTMCKQSGIPVHKVFHLTAGAPGITNAATGVVLSAPNLNDWNEVPLRELLEAATGFSCIAENDTNLAALGESWCGAARGVESFVFIALGTGVGAGIFLNGDLYRGAQWSAGEIGYFGVNGKKRQSVLMREVGQLEGIIGGAGIESEWRCRLQESEASSVSAAYKLKASQIFDLAAEGDRIACEMVHWTAGILADSIVDMALLLDPEMVVLGGGVGAHPELCRATEKFLRQHEFAQPCLRSSSLGTQAQLQGAISVSVAAVEAGLLDQGSSRARGAGPERFALDFAATKP